MTEEKLNIEGIRSDLFLAFLELEPASTANLRRKRINGEVARLVRGATLFAESEGIADQARDDIAGLKVTLEGMRDEYLGAFEQHTDTRSAVLALAREVPILVKLEQGFKALAKEAEGMIEVKSPQIVAKALELLMNQKLGDIVGSLYSLGEVSEHADVAGRRPVEVTRRVNLLNRLRDYHLEEYLEACRDRDKVPQDSVHAARFASGLPCRNQNGSRNLIMNFALFHEEEAVWLYPKRTLPWLELKAALKSSGLTCSNDRFTLQRKGTVPVWQSRTVVFASFFLNGLEVYDFERPGVAWDGLRLGYLLASLPPKFVVSYVELVFRVAAELASEVYFCGEVIKEPELRNALEKAVKEVEENFGIPGSEEVASQIEVTYPRNHLT